MSAPQTSVANPFPRTTRSLTADSHATTLLAMLTVVLLLLVWAVWFFVTGISIYRSSDQAEVTSAQRVTAYFPLEAAQDFKRGQAASFYPQGAEWEKDSPITAIVASTESIDKQTRVELALRPERSLSAPIKPGQTGRIQVETERVSPATLVFRAGGLVNHGSE